MKDEKYEIEFDIIGAGKLYISDNDLCSCGGEEGIAFEVSWSKYGRSGGMISRKEARLLANKILEILDNSPQSK